VWPSPSLRSSGGSWSDGRGVAGGVASGDGGDQSSCIDRSDGITEPLDDVRRRRNVRWSRPLLEPADLWTVEEVEEPGHAALVHGLLLCLHQVLRARHNLIGLLLCVLRLRSRRRSAGVERRRSSDVQVDLLQKVITNFKKVRERRGAPDDGPKVLEVLVEEILGGSCLPLEVGDGSLFLLQE
jgi:hypothetical protein